MYEHQRLMYYQLKNFLENGDPGCRIAVLVGIRRIGKTGILTDLEESLPHAKYINMDPKSGTKNAMQEYTRFMKTGKGFLLLDEVTHLPEYEDLIADVLFAVYNKCPELRVVFTGSSSLHMLWMHYSSLGGGRSKLFRCSFLSFVEYLHFTGKVTSYDTCSKDTITEQAFCDYLQMKGLESSGFNLVFNQGYMNSLYQDMADSNNSASRPGNITWFSQADLMCILDLVSYTLSNIVSYQKLLKPGISKESKALGAQLDDIGGLRIVLSAKQVERMNPESIANALYFLLETNLAYAEVRYEDSANQSVEKLVNALKVSKSAGALMQIFESYNICLKSPLWYTRLSVDILNRIGATIEDLLSTRVLGDILENYVKGSYCDLMPSIDYQIFKIGSPPLRATNKQREQTAEVDLYDPANQLLCELAMGNKDYRDVNLMKHAKEIPCIRVLSTKDIHNFSAGTHKIPYPKLCVMVDTGEILALSRTSKIKALDSTDDQ